MADEQQVTTALKSISDEHWNAHGLPIFLSNLPPMLEEAAAGYKESLGTRSLKAFIKEVGPVAGFKLIEHPTQKAKLAVAPTGAEYEFPMEDPRPTRSGGGDAGVGQEPVLALLRALASLPPEDLEKVVIPVATLVKLLK
jgi:hypothetical protein